MRNSSLFFINLSVGVVVLTGLLTHASVTTQSQQKQLEEKSRLVRAFRLTDLCLFAEARYTRHLSQADLNTPFQDHPLSLEHFPSGSFTQPPLGITNRHDPMD